MCVRRRMKEEVVGEGEGGKRGSGRKRRGGRLIQSRNSERDGFSALSATARDAEEEEEEEEEEEGLFRRRRKGRREGM